MDFEHSARICNSGDQRERGGLRARGVRRGRRGRGRSTSQVRRCGRGAHFSICMRYECHDTLVNLFLLFIYRDDKTSIFSWFFACVFVRYQPGMIAENFFCVRRKLNSRSIA